VPSAAHHCFAFLAVCSLCPAQDLAALSKQGADAMRAKRYSDAETAYRLLIEQDPQNPMWRMNLGLALHSAGRFATAIPEFELFVKAKPEPGAIHFLLGLSHLKLNQPCPAITPLEKAMLWDRQRAAVELADAYYGCKRYERAARTYEVALNSTDKKAAIERQAAHCFWLARLYGDARRHFAPLAAGLAADPNFNYEYGDTLARLEGPEAGLPYLRRAVDAAPQLLAARGELGKALVATGAARDAIPHLEAAAPEDPTLLLPLARAYRADGRAEDADRAQKEYRARVGTK
jgi:tetratricopeptide (TPR) repeat protein